MSWRLIPYHIGDSAWNMAVDEAIFYCYLHDLVPPTLRFYGWRLPTLSVGFFQEIESEIDLASLANRGFGFVRRNTGGRAVLHHHELTYSVIAGIRDGLPDGLIESYLYISKAFVDAFQHFGVSAELHQGAAGKGKGAGACFESPSWYELTVGDRKLVGSAQLRQQGSLLQHGSILLDFSPLDLGSVLKFQELSLHDWANRLRAKVTSFSDIGVQVEPVDLATEIMNSFSKLYDLKFTEGSLIKEEIELVDQLIRTKYANDKWNLTRGNSNSRHCIIANRQ